MFTLFSVVILFSAAANAGVVALRDDVPGVWSSQDGGNTRVHFGDDKVYVGACDPSDIINTLYAQCYTDGFCNPASWTMECEEGDRASHTITLTAPEGQYQTWIRNGLVEAMRNAIHTGKLIEKKKITAMSGGGCVGCTWTGTDIDTYHMPATIGISHSNDGTVPDVITLTIVNNDEASDKGLCGILTGLGAGVAGAVNGAAGGIFQVASVACNAI